MSKSFNNRVFGSVILRSINSNFNADFTHHPRTLPDGTVYSTDKALKYSVKDYLRKNYPDDKLFYIKRYNNNLNPMTLDETYEALFGEMPKAASKGKDDSLRMPVLTNLFKCLDIRLFGATFAGKVNLSVHGTVQINHGINKFMGNEIYTEDILSPFRNPGSEGSEEKGMTTIGNQTNLQEGHYVFHFSVNPKNNEDFYKMINDSNSLNSLALTTDDINKLKEALNRSVSYLDSSRKMGTENEATLWIQLKEDSKLVLPGLTELISINSERVIDFSQVQKVISDASDEIELVEFYFNPATTKICGLDKNEKTKFINILNNKEF